MDFSLICFISLLQVVMSLSGLLNSVLKWINLIIVIMTISLNLINGQEMQQFSQDYTKHPCYLNRVCSTTPQSRMTCGYNFTLSHNYVLSKHCRNCPENIHHCSLAGCIPADGIRRGISIVNELLPGPAIRVCEGDVVVVDVTNHLAGQGTSIHWHGILQKNTPWFDGVPGLNQCPINPGHTFRYEFETPLAGTNYWHSHEGLQRADGIFGALIVRPPKEKLGNSLLYDFDLAEHELLVWDWLPNMAMSSMIRSHIWNARDHPKSILINGKGFPPSFFQDFGPQETIQTKGKKFIPIHEIRIQQNSAYRIRLMSNGVVECPLEISIENHTLEVIASDGHDITPVIVESLIIFAGERYDFVLRGNQKIGSYWIKFKGLIDCDERFTSAFQLAVLNYEGIPLGTLPTHSIKSWLESSPSGNVAGGRQLNPMNSGPNNDGRIFIPLSNISSDPSIDDDPEILTRDRPDHQFYISYDFNRIRNFTPFSVQEGKKKGLLTDANEPPLEDLVHFLPQLNFISHIQPASPPLSQPETIKLIDKCNEDSKRAQGINCTVEHCRCTHWINVQLNSIVELVLVDKGQGFDASHPFHLHGHIFRIVAIERLGTSTDPETVRQRDNQGLINRRRSRAMMKDTVAVPDGGYTILRFRANNPGYWMFHCHVEFHAEEGMGLMLQVGEMNQMPRPPRDFPKCSNYLPPFSSRSPIQRL